MEGEKKPDSAASSGAVENKEQQGTEKNIEDLVKDIDNEEQDDDIDSLLKNIDNSTEQLEATSELAAAAAVADSDARSVVLDNVHFNATKEEIEELFRPCGEILRVTILLDARTRRSRGRAYVEFKPSSELDTKASNSVGKALLLDQTLFKGRPISVTRKRTIKRPLSFTGSADASMVGRTTYRGRGGGYRGSYRGRGGRGGRRF